MRYTYTGDKQEICKGVCCIENKSEICKWITHAREINPLTNLFSGLSKFQKVVQSVRFTADFSHRKFSEYVKKYMINI